MMWNSQQIKLTAPLFFSEYFTDELLNIMAEETNLFAVQNNSVFRATTPEEMRTFVGIHILMGNLHYPKVRFYWNQKLSIPIISPVMTVNRFFKLRQDVDFVNSDEAIRRAKC
jgi:hypothetical protein